MCGSVCRRMCHDKRTCIFSYTPTHMQVHILRFSANGPEPRCWNPRPPFMRAAVYQIFACARLAPRVHVCNYMHVSPPPPSRTGYVRSRASRIPRNAAGIHMHRPAVCKRGEPQRESVSHRRLSRTVVQPFLVISRLACREAGIAGSLIVLEDYWMLLGIVEPLCFWTNKR